MSLKRCSPGHALALPRACFPVRVLAGANRARFRRRFWVQGWEGLMYEKLDA